MRLSKIKLAGFKTFVDPTTVVLPGNLAGVVGPNGCGKSNIIDAVRWVMGESSAKNLRGDDLTDVIFNGSNARKPVGTASIELLFDNSDGKIGGEYAGYSEVSIKRVMSRDGVSVYSLNNTRCRRKDITRVFLGTGLGPRSYSIIEQGMISRVIEAKPEEMRVYVEEAAGISRYKDRRRETNNRIRHTRDNLDRLNDLRDEVNKQLKHLQRQANMAEKFKTYKADQRRLSAEVIALRLAELNDRQVIEARLTREKETELEAAIARLRKLESKIEKSRAEHSDKSESFSKVQESYYKIGAEIGRIEQFIQHTRDLKKRQQADLDECMQGLQELDERATSDANRVAELDRSLQDLTPKWDTLGKAASRSEASWQHAEDAMQEWHNGWDDVQRESSELERATSVEQTRIEHLQTELQTLVTRQERVRVERSQLSVDEMNAELEELQAQQTNRTRRLEEAKQTLEATAREIQGCREEERTLTARLDDQRAQLQQSKGRLASLEALQQDALGERAGGISDWIEKAGLTQQPRLAQRLEVEPGWELAVETVLGDFLEAVCVDGVDATVDALGQLEAGRLTLVDVAGTSVGAGATGTTLASKILGGNAVASVLERVRVADSLSHALSLRATLSAGESIATADGVWLGVDWLRVNKAEQQSGGVIVREQEIRALAATCELLSGEVADLTRREDQARTRLKGLETRRDEEQDAVNQAHRDHVDLLAALEARRSRFDHLSDRVSTLAADADEIQRQITNADRGLNEARERRNSARTALEDVVARKQRLEDRQAGRRQQLEDARQSYEDDRRAAHEIEVQIESKRSSHNSIEENLQRQREQMTRLVERRNTLTEQIAQADTPLSEHQDQLNGLLEDRLAVEGALTDARREMESIDERLREQQEQRNVARNEVEECREAVEAVRISAQEIKVRRDGLLERFAETGFDLDEMAEELPENASVEQWQESLEKIENRIQRLGPINLAAIDEHKENSERKEYLDRQFDDLTEALDTLEQAIRKIDRETRTRFSETFENINEGFKRLFPKLFGGGHAYLELTDTDLLTAGVTVMARPPGKRNSTIHLLSGGEKALTAVALVFSIFELNPAPFCLLDEVDAPLDDANVNRFCNIIREMSDRVQFVVITHNKTTIAMADQLIGVTMQEAGVSRLVAVDVDAAIEMAEAS